MDNNKKFKSSLFGFSRKSVSDYVLGLSEDFTKRIADLEAQLKEAQELIKQKDLKIAELDAQRLHVAETLLKSKVEADHIVSTAQAEADGMISDAESKASGMVSSAKNEAELIVDTARTEAVELKRTNEDELKALKEQKDYVAQCINSLKLDVLSAYEVYMLKLEKSMELNGVISLENGSIEVKEEEISAPTEDSTKTEDSAKTEEAEAEQETAADGKETPLKENRISNGIFTPDDTKDFNF